MKVWVRVFLVFLGLVLIGFGGYWTFFEKSDLSQMGSSYRPFFNKAQILAEKRQFREAEVLLKKALEKNPNAGEVHSSLSASYFFQRKNLDEAKRFAEKAILLSPNLARAYNNLGNVLFVQGSLDEAKKNYEHALRLDHKLHHGHFNLALIHLKQGQGLKAEERLKSVLALDEKHQGALRYLASLSCRLNKWTQCYGVLKSYEKHYPKQPDVYLNQVRVLIKLGNQAAISQVLERAKASKIDPKYLDQMRQVLAKQGLSY